MPGTKSGTDIPVCRTGIRSKFKFGLLLVHSGHFRTYVTSSVKASFCSLRNAIPLLGINTAPRSPTGASGGSDRRRAGKLLRSYHWSSQIGLSTPSGVYAVWLVLTSGEYSRCLSVAEGFDRIRSGGLRGKRERTVGIHRSSPLGGDFSCRCAG